MDKIFDLTRPIDDYDLVVFDIETTGLDFVFGEKICEIGAVKCRKETIIDSFDTLINPQKKVSVEAFRVHKISDEELEHAPIFSDLADKVKMFFQGSVACAYNAGFDIGFMNNSLKISGMGPLSVPAIDILGLARDVLSLTSYRLQSVAEYLGLSCGRRSHRALDDALTARGVFIKLADLIKEKGVYNLCDYFSLYGFADQAYLSGENAKIHLLEKAIKDNERLRMRCFFRERGIMEVTALPLRVGREKNKYYLLYQDPGGKSVNIAVSRILNIE